MLLHNVVMYQHVFLHMFYHYYVSMLLVVGVVDRFRIKAPFVSPELCWLFV